LNKKEHILKIEEKNKNKFYIKETIKKYLKRKGRMRLK